MPPLLSIDDLQMILSPHCGRIGPAIWSAWEQYQTIGAAERLTFDQTAEAGVLNRFIITNIKREFTQVAGVRLIEGVGFMLGLEGWPSGIDGSVVCRFKKLSAAGESRSYQTHRAQAIKANNTGVLDGIPSEATIVDVGFVLNDLGTGFRDVQAIRVKDTAFIMSFPRAGSAAVMPLPRPLIGPGSPRFIITKRNEADSSGDSK